MDHDHSDKTSESEAVADAPFNATLEIPSASKTPASTVVSSSASALLEKIQPLLPSLIIVLGIVLRISQYALDRSLFLDEAFVATSIAERSIAGLLQPLQFDQRAPAGFLACVKLATLCFGKSDLALRLVPLISGILSVILFSVLSQKLLPRAAANFASLLFAASPPLIFMASDLKQYSTDALMTTAILLSSVFAVQYQLSMRQTIVLGLVGVVALWFSFPAVFVLAGIGLTLFVAAVLERNWQQMPHLAILAAMWGVGFVSLWWMQLRFFDSEPGWKKLWDDAFMPLPPRSLKQLWWIPERIFHMVTNPVGLTYPGLAGLAGVAGIVAVYRQSRMNLSLLLTPIVVTLLASGCRIYPVSGRSIIFMAPLLTLIIVAGMHYIRLNVTQPGLKWMWVFIIVFTCADLAHSASAHLTKRKMYKNQLFWDYKFEEMKPLMAHIRSHWEQGDLVYLYSQSHVAFEFYADQYGFVPSDSVRGIEAGMANPRWEEIEADLAKLSGRKRIWFVFTHNWTGNEVSDRKLYKYFLDKQGKCLDTLELEHPIDAAVYLYDLAKPSE